MDVEIKFFRLYNESVKDVKSTPVKHLLHMTMLDSTKRIDISQIAIQNLESEQVFSEQKKDIIEGLTIQIGIEKDSIDRSKNMMDNIWIHRNNCLKALIEKLRNDEKRHHNTLKKLTDKALLLSDTPDFVSIFRNLE